MKKISKLKSNKKSKKLSIKLRSNKKIKKSKFKLKSSKVFSKKNLKIKSNKKSSKNIKQYSSLSSNNITYTPFHKKFFLKHSISSHQRNIFLKNNINTTLQPVINSEPSTCGSVCSGK